MDVNKLKRAKQIIKPIEKMGDMESRKIWQKVSEAIRNNDTSLVSKEKSIIENQKRAEKKQREEQGLEWKPAHFEWVENEPTIEKLQTMLNKVVKSKHQSSGYGNWVFKQPKKEQEVTIKQEEA